MPGLCAHCGNHATLVCVKCKQSPSGDLKSIHTIFYCSNACQQVDWPQHKSYCKAMKQRKDLSLAADIVQQVAYICREATYENPTSRIEHRADKLLLHELPNGTIKSRRCHTLPQSLLRSISEKEKAAMLSCDSCSDALAMTYEVIQWLLRGMYSSSSL